LSSQASDLRGNAPTKPNDSRTSLLGNKITKSAIRSFRPIIPVVAAVCIWWILTTTVLVQPRIFPTPPQVWDELIAIASNDSPLGSTYAHLRATIGRLLTAFVVSYVLGTVLGTIAGRVKSVFDFSTSLVWIAFAVPSVVWVFVFLIVFGISETVPVMALVVLLTAPVFIGTAEGVKATPRDLLEMARSCKVTKVRMFFDVILPSIRPYLFANARIAFALGIKLVIVAEVVGLPNGAGQIIRYWSDSLYMAPVVAWGIVLMLLGVIADKFVFGYFERREDRRYGNRAELV
jgi:NitT/TauT family transport system permease protein